MVWSVRVTSQQLPSDRGYAIEYTLEFLDEEELRVRGLGGQEILSGRVRTILDGEPAEIEIHLRNERMPLAIYQDGGRWSQPGKVPLG